MDGKMFHDWTLQFDAEVTIHSLITVDRVTEVVFHDFYHHDVFLYLTTDHLLMFPNVSFKTCFYYLVVL